MNLANRMTYLPERFALRGTQLLLGLLFFQNGLVANAAVAGGKLAFVAFVGSDGVHVPRASSLFGFEVSAWSQTLWPTSKDWKLYRPDSDLTQHGAAVVQEMGKYYKERYILNDGLLSNSCPSVNEIFAVADTKSATSKYTMRKFVGALLDAGCDIEGYVHEDLYALGYSLRKSSCPNVPATGVQLLSECTHVRIAELVARGDNSSCTSDHDASYLPESRKVGELLGCCDTPAVCATSGETCVLPTLQEVSPTDVWSVSAQFDALNFFSSAFLMQALNNMQAAWGQLSLREAVQLAARPLVDYLELTNSLFQSRTSAGSTVLGLITATLKQAVTGKSLGTNLPDARAKALFIFLHESDQYLLRQALGLNWRAQGWLSRNPTPPGWKVPLLANRKAPHASYLLSVGICLLRNKLCKAVHV
ncbi:hypothetical protein CYMTET_42418 [Cymbomonas tetramitiformis]|uniref:Uncharacterized protein n=1 Tax=Cymbomonas tetramitiformis TaxID=36881 RepID=A0AAE0C5V5_9CHLO|nr:hypothetical protein CYMTET_42418 [Cymbomonas tetramitiformis]